MKYSDFTGFWNHLHRRYSSYCNKYYRDNPHIRNCCIRIHIVPVYVNTTL